MVEDETPAEEAVSHVIPGQPMPGPQYLAQLHAQQAQSQAEMQDAQLAVNSLSNASADQQQLGASTGAYSANGQQLSISQQHQLRLKANEHMQAVLANRKAYLDTQIAAQQQATQQAQQQDLSSGSQGSTFGPSSERGVAAAPQQQAQQAATATVLYAAAATKQQGQSRTFAQVQAAPQGGGYTQHITVQAPPAVSQPATAAAQQLATTQPGTNAQGQQDQPPFTIKTGNPIQVCSLSMSSSASTNRYILCLFKWDIQHV